MTNAQRAAAVPQPEHRFFAALYDRLADSKSVRAIRAEVCDGAHGVVLEVGCGTGLNLAYYDWARIDSLKLTEPDPYMFKRIQPRVEALPGQVRTRIRAEQAPAEALPFEDASFDVVVSTLVLCTVEQPHRALSEIRRVLKPGGELRLFEHVRGHGVLRRIQRTIQPVYGWASGNCQLSRDTEAAVESAGFDLRVSRRTSLGPLWPAFVGVARKNAASSETHTQTS